MKNNNLHNFYMLSTNNLNIINNIDYFISKIM